GRLLCPPDPRTRPGAAGVGCIRHLRGRQMATPARTYAASEVRRRDTRIQALSFVGPATSAAGVIWAIMQPYRVTLFHPRGQGFWWLVTEPPLLVIAVGLLFAIFVARPLIADLEARDATS